MSFFVGWIDLLSVTLFFQFSTRANANILALTLEMNAKDVKLETMRTEIESQKLVLAGEEVHVAKCAEVLGNAKAAEV